MKLLAILHLVLLTGCSHVCWYPATDWGFRYEVDADQRTPGGISIDTTGQLLHPYTFALLDKMTAEVENCLIEVIPNKILSDEQIKTLHCRQRDIKHLCAKDCLKVKIPDTWHLSKTDPSQELLADKAPASGCTDKGLDGGECYWRAGLQDGFVIITTPNLYLYKDALIKYMTRCEYVWAEPLSKCAVPGVEPDWNKK